jgi:murein DD-endopeptidase MepM/ murein hydrolase activator NlpD
VRPAKLVSMPGSRRLTMLVLTGAAAAVAFGVPAASGQSVWDKKRHVDERISGLQAEIARAKEREGALSSEIGAASSQIDALAGRIGDLSDRLAVLERELAAHRARLDRLEQRFREQTRHLNRLVQQHAVAQRRLEARIVALYQAQETSEVDVLLQAESLVDLIEQLDYFRQIGEQDRAIADEIKRLKIAMRVARKKTVATKAEVADATAVLAEKTEAERAARAALIAQQSALAAARSGKRSLLANVREERHEHEEDLEAMLAASAQLAATIQAAQASSSSGGGGGSSGSGAAPSSGFIWPTSGVVTSGFGWRWGRMHEGIDISAPAGTSVVAVASGTVIFAGWMGGYGQLVIIDHGGGLATAYAHLSSIHAGGSVSQGQSIGAVGCTGSCTGNHLHFEVRVNGSAVDPMGYL